MKGGVRLRCEEAGEYWTGWPAKIERITAFMLINDIFMADGLVRWSVKNRWILNHKKPGPRELELDYHKKIEFKPGQTITHYYARRCVHCVQDGKRAAMAGNVDRALMCWANAETEAERLYGSWLHTLAVRSSKQTQGVKRYGEERRSNTRERVRRALFCLPEFERYGRGVTRLIADRLILSETQTRAHIQALGYGAKNKKHGA